ncbi:hypothetical protein GQ54DRAFT_309269 [Martensiomyces pterosporus]|nr:hypothetical protein GQ54DRAFT_309269 [Martensiomyces pterosporus]
MMMNEHDYLEKRREAQDLLFLLNDLRSRPIPPIDWYTPNYLHIPNVMFLDNLWLRPEVLETTINGRDLKLSQVRALIRPDIVKDMLARIQHFVDAPQTAPVSAPVTPPVVMAPAPTFHSLARVQTGSYSRLPEIVDVSRGQSPAQYDQQADGSPTTADSSRAGTTAPAGPTGPTGPTTATVRPKAFTRGMRKGFFLQGCLGSGKSHALLIFALYIRLTYPNIRTVFIGDCAQWDKCDGTFEYLELVFEGIACALIDHEEILALIDAWREEFRSKTTHLGDHASRLITKISDYCRIRGLKIVFLYDNIDKMTANKNFFEHAAYRTIMNLKRKQPFFAVFSSFDENITEDIKRRFTSTYHHISSSYTREEGLVYIAQRCPLLKLDERMINEFVKSTWFHPNELRRLCRALAKARTEQEFDRLNQHFRGQVDFALNPRPYSAHRTPAGSDIKLTIFRSYFSFPCEDPVIDWNYIDTSSGSDGVLRFSCPRIANLVFTEQLGDEKSAFQQIGLIIGDTDEARHQLAVAALRWILDKKGEFIEENVPRSRARVPLRHLDTSTERLRATDTGDFINKMAASVSTIDTTPIIAYYCVDPVIDDIDFVLYNERELRSVKFIKCVMCKPLKLKIELRHIDTEISRMIKRNFDNDNRPAEFYIVCSRKAAGFASRRLPRVSEIGCSVHIVDITSLNWIKNLEIYQFN